jgi:hypothetical protein
MNWRGGAGLTRRSFLKVSLAIGAAGLAPAVPARAEHLPRIASALALPFSHQRLPDPDELLTGRLPGCDLLLVPAYIAAGLLQQQKLQPLALAERHPGRGHDPDGAFTRPHAYRVTALLTRDASALGLEALWEAPADALWPANARLLIGKALLRRGYSPNEQHPGRLAQAMADLAVLGPRIVPDPVAALRAGSGRLALVLVEASGHVPDRARCLAGGQLRRLEHSLLIEYDWVVPITAERPGDALVFLNHLPAPSSPPRPAPGQRLVPLAPLGSGALRQQVAFWSGVAGGRAAKPS